MMIEPSVKINLREGFMAILSGEFPIDASTYSIFNVKPLQYWKYLFAEGREYGWSEEEIFVALAKYQPNFKKDLVMHQLEERNYLEASPLKKQTYDKYFPDHKIVTKKKSKLPDIEWDVILDQWWERTFHLTYRYIPELKTWYHYEEGTFEPILIETIQSIVKNWLRDNFFKSGPRRIFHALQSIKLMENITTPLQTFDADQGAILNIKRGLLHLDKTGKKKPYLTPHTPEYPSLIQMNVEYLGEHTLSLPCWEKIAEDYPQQLRIIGWFLRSIIYNQMENEKALFVVGKTRSGKGTVLNLIESMFHSKQISSQGVSDLGGKNSLGQLIRCLLSLNKEATLQRIIPKAMKRFKGITGRDGKQVIDVKNVPLFEHDFDAMFFIEAGNYCYQYPTTDVNAFFSRWVMVEYNTQSYDPIPQFKEDLLKEKDAIFTMWVNQGYETYATFYEREYQRSYSLQTDIKAVKALWHKWSDPVTMVCDELFEFVNSESTMEEAFVIAEVRVAMEENNFFSGRQGSLSPKIKIALKNQLIHFHHSNNYKYFRCIRFKDTDRQDQYEIDNPPADPSPEALKQKRERTFLQLPKYTEGEYDHLIEQHLEENL